MESRGRSSEKIFLNGDVYCGNYKGTLPQGKGKYTWSDGKFYEGDWEEGKMTGKGKVLWPSGTSYEGDFSGGYLHGFGILTSSDGSVYRGSWKLNTRHGFGEKHYQNSDVYEGTWKEGKHEGSGKYVWSNGNMYIGTWKAGNMCGKGVMKWSTGDLFDGFWLNGLRNGSGFYKFEDGGCYSGMWTKGIKDGWGKFYPEGSNRPSLAKWSNSELVNEKVEGSIRLSSSTKSEFKVIKPSFKLSVSKIALNGFSKGVTRRLHKRIVLKGNQNPCHSVADGTLEEVQRVVQHSSSRVYEREYMQGVLIKERIMNCTGRTNSIKRRGRTKDARKKSLMSTYAGLQSYYLMLSLQVGIRYIVGKISPVPMREVRLSDFRGRVQMYFPTRGSQMTPPHCSLDFYWTDYCPIVFRNLREMFKLDSADYMMSICGGDGLTELSSAGKSGSLFYLSHDDRFVIKTLKRSELKVLLEMLPSYYEHVKAHENTLLPKFFGVHQIAWKVGRKASFVVMENMLCTVLRIHRRYELKGSCQGRVTNKEDIKENTTFKDLDLPYVFHMDKLLHESLLKQITLDCRFLESRQIINYSLLLGLHFRAPGNLKAFLETEESMQQPEHTFASTSVDAISEDEMLNPPKGLLLVTHERNFVSTAPGPHIRGNTLRAFSSMGEKEVDLLLPETRRLRVQLGVNMPAQASHKLPQDGGDASEAELFEVYDVVLYLGIIDILQEYNLKKKVELAYKSFKYDPMSISVMEPTPYSKRFVNFLERVFIPT